MTRVAVWMLWAALVCGCGPATLEGALRSGASAPPEPAVVLAHPGARVEVSDAEFRSAMRWLVESAASARLGLSTGWRSGRVIPAAWEIPPDKAGTQLAREYSKWCQLVRHGPVDCLSLGVESFGVEGKRRLALSIAIGSVLGGAADVIGELANPFKVEAMVVAALGTYLFLLCVPEPVSKGVSVVMTVALYAYLGHELWDIVRAYERMRDEADAATTFAEVVAAGERFGHSIGQNATRILIMLATARLGTRMEASVQRLPGFTQASRAVEFETSVGATVQGQTLTLPGVLSQASAVVLGKGKLGVVLAADAMAMTGTGNAGGGNYGSRSPPGQTPSTEEIRRKIEGVLKRDGRWIGHKGSSTDIRELKGGMGEAQRLFDELSAGGTKVTGSTYKGTLVRLGNDEYVGLRAVSKSGPVTIDINVPGLAIREIKFLP